MAEKRRIISSSEDLVSMFLGLVIVIVVGGLVVNYFQKNRGKVDVPGVSTETGEVKKLLTPTGGVVGGGKAYEVVRGDSLWKIATREYGSGYKWMEIAKTNKLKQPNLLAIDQKLILPELIGVAGNREAIIETDEYKVARGDNLWRISLRKYGDGFAWVKVWQANRGALRDPNKLEIGMKLVLPKI